MFQAMSCKVAQVPSKYGNKCGSSLIYMSLFIKMADHVKIGGTSAKGNNVSLSTRHCSRGSYFKVIVIKQADSCEAARGYFVS
jgi:hypothetical protein